MNQHIARSTRILLIDDHALVRRGIKSLIAPHAEFDVCGEADNVQSGLDQCRELLPDLVIADLSLDGLSGLDMIKQIKQEHPRVPVLVLTMHDEELFAERCLRAGASGFVSKDMANEHVIDAIKTVVAGDIFLSNEASNQMIQQSLGKSPGQDSPISRLTDRELEVFSQIGQGKTTREIAEMLGLSIKTIESYREHIKNKLSLANSSELMRHAVRWVLENG